MRKSAGLICGLAAAFGILTMTAQAPARADKPVAIEKEFLGIRMLQSYKQVLARYGAPTYVFRIGDPLLLLDARNLKGEITGGVVGIDNGGSSTGTNGGGAAGGGGGGRLGGGPPASSGGAGGGGGGIPPQYAQYAQQGGGGGKRPQGGGAPGSSGGGGAPATSGGGNAGGAQGDGDQTFGSSGGFMWAYHYPKQELAYIYVFNKDGRVEVIIERGRLGGQKTSRGIGLGDSIASVYKTYGWTDSIKAERENMFSLYYNDKYHAQFVTVKNKVIGVIVALRETQKLQFLDGSGGSTGSNASGGPGGGGGRLPGGGGPPGSAGGGARTLQGAGGGKRFPGAVGGGGGAG